jgi:hypothetical protein
MLCYNRRKWWRSRLDWVDANGRLDWAPWEHYAGDFNGRSGHEDRWVSRYWRTVNDRGAGLAVV